MMLGEGILNIPLNSRLLKSGKDDSRKTSWQWALSSKKANTREQLAKIRQQQAVRNQPIRQGFLNSDFRTAYCYLPINFPWRLGAKNFLSRSVEDLMGKNLRPGKNRIKRRIFAWRDWMAA